jgi:methanogenic corrinoid protein MtbC1
MTRLIAEGLSAAEAARQAGTGTGDDLRPVVDAPIVDQLAAQFRSALDEFDGAGAHAVFDRLLASISLEVVLGDVVLPYLRDLGERWAAGRANVAQEHFASNLVRGRLLALARDWDTGTGPALLLACLPGEAHDLGLIIFGILTARRGWRVTLLGADTPIDTLTASIGLIRPSLTVVLATRPSLLAEHADELRKLTAATRTAIAGVTDTAAIVALGAAVLPSDIVEAARSVNP